VDIKSGIDGRVTNTGTQHFTDGDMRFYEGKYIQYVPKTTQSNIAFVLNTTHGFWLDDTELDIPAQLNMDLRKVYGGYHADVKKGESLRIEKYCNVYTARDFDMQGKTVADIQVLSLEQVKGAYHDCRFCRRASPI